MASWVLSSCSPGISPFRPARQVGFTISFSICVVFALYISQPQLRTLDLSSGDAAWYCGASRNGSRFSRKSSWPGTKSGSSSAFFTCARRPQFVASRSISSRVCDISADPDWSAKLASVSSIMITPKRVFQKSGRRRVTSAETARRELTVEHVQPVLHGEHLRDLVGG